MAGNHTLNCGTECPFTASAVAGANESVERLGFQLPPGGRAKANTPTLRRSARCLLSSSERRCGTWSSQLDVQKVKRCNTNRFRRQRFAGVRMDHRKPTSGPVVLGLGATALDYLATVERYPQPDEKIRSQSLTIQGGGNVANTLTALARLGVATRLATKLGDDAIGRDILAELQHEGVDTSFVAIKTNMNSPITYVIVDASTRTRTCIHTPAAEELLASDVVNRDALWERVALVHLDSRHTSAALALAREAVQRGIPVVLDIEKDRPHALDLVALADYIITNATYPLHFSAQPGMSANRLTALSGLVAIMDYGRAAFAISTQGAEGSLMVRRRHNVDGLYALGHETEEPAPTGLPILVQSDTYPPATACGSCEPQYDVLRCPAWPLSRPVVDTTGAGDAYIAGVIYALLHGLSDGQAMALGSFVAAEKLAGPGARSALPRLEQVPPALRARVQAPSNWRSG